MENKRFASKIKGLGVISCAEGRHRGKVNEVYLDRETKKVTGFSFKERIFQMDGKSFIGLNDVQCLGEDVVIVPDDSAVKKLTDDLDGGAMKKIEGQLITTQEGAYIGRLADLVIDVQSGQIIAVVMDGDKILNIDPGDITFGPDTIMVPASYANNIRDAEPQGEKTISDRFDTTRIREAYKETADRLGSAMDLVKKRIRPGSDASSDSEKND